MARCQARSTFYAAEIKMSMAVFVDLGLAATSSRRQPRGRELLSYEQET